ncbi:28 kDa heat- and acid-stable phosphoprotein-like isoform X1 [Orbicella faveolata]|uniref:28 kDa heat- and acid-stable phosphoprotein-like isoform X1 n=1 Tax=Orbicella faveolata TaxID=48498 RepID=UPI0009E614D9|nr:28 kDa heat- and acid-stable phosphoprotein-like isoform X1 [Orbicella faveolata]
MISKQLSRGKVHHKGRRRHFTDAEELRMEMEREKREQEWREKKEGEDSDEEGKKGAAAADKPASDSDEDSESDEEEVKPKGVSGLIEIENPNRVAQKMKKASDVQLNDDTSSQLSRREREEIARQRNAARQRKLQEEGKTDQARADLARLAVIRKQREDAAKKREEQKKAKEAAEATKNTKR